MSPDHTDPVMEAFGDLARALDWTAPAIEWPAVKALFKLLDVHAHELAGRIRDHADADNDYYSPAGQYVAADLIDPEVSE
ncbi:hypothetical protein OTB20_08485 [Streptomyces sp. H27-H1]|uniref:hypothetical protein n=1 Tax=Streptomyces sp. H27-H1 TaxID=2996461 RepID=UPI0022721AED|nr:hypothetical protein [Streptomyces sp. H27-H1]MCY0926242.1 hypothetical protein [Streptomyces sp. H27-H1]